MWNTWIEKAAKAAASLDATLNESVGTPETPAANPSSSTTAGGSETIANTWNDDDFKFDDDDEAPAVTTPAETAAALETSPPPAPVVEPEQPPVVPETNGSWAEDDNAAFDHFDGVAPPGETPPQKPSGALSIALGGLRDKVKVPGKVSEINFMSPFSSLMTSISNDQEEAHALQEQETVPSTPLRERPAEEQPSKVDLTIVPSLDQGETDAAWQEEELDLPDDETQPLPTKPDEQTDEIEPKVPKSLQEEKKTEEKPGEVPDSKLEKSKESIPVQPESEVAPSETPAMEVLVPTPAVATTSVPTGAVVSSSELEEIKTLLAQREEQLAAKAEQMFQLQQMYEKEKQELAKKNAETKEEAKKRIQKARERCEAAEAKLQASTSALTEDAAQQAQLVAALREEGEKLARKQAEMEKNVRAARGEARELKELLQDETAAKQDALAKIEKLQADLKSTQEQLSSARKGETQAGKLDSELQTAREEIAKKENTIMSLEQAVKELKAEKKDLIQQVEASKQGAAEESLREAKRLRKQHQDAVADLQGKLQTSEREAALREDQLRHEVEELRKRWQDAVRRADALSMDVQSSTAPLLRQLESMERQHRVRASAAAELETKLRAELEETVIQNEKLIKDHSELRTTCGRLERQSKGQESDLTDRQKKIDEMTEKIARLEEKLQTLQIEGEKRQEEYEKVERLANEGVSKVRSEMSQAVVESEERYRSQIQTMKEELRIEKEKRTQLEKQVDNLLENAAVIVPHPSNEFMKESKPAKLVKSEGQAQILEGALRGLGGESDDDDNYTDDEDLAGPPLPSPAGSSFAALQQLTQNLKAAKKELETLRKRLEESELSRESLVEELGESRDAKEKLPLFEAKVRELMADNQEKELEIRGLQDDIAEVKEMYRTQLSVLVEEKAAAFAVAAASKKTMNGSKKEPPLAEERPPEKVPQLVEEVIPIA